MSLTIINTTATPAFPPELENGLYTLDTYTPRSRSRTYYDLVLHPLLYLASFLFTIARRVSRHLRFWDEPGDARNFVPYLPTPTHPAETEFDPLTERTHLLYSPAGSISSSLSSATSSPAPSTPTSSASSIVLLRSALKKPNEKPASLPIAIGMTHHAAFDFSMAQQPTMERKNVRFTDNDETHVFVIESWEAKLKKGGGRSIGKWTKDGKTIVWGGDDDALSDAADSNRGADDDDDILSGRKGIYAWFLGAGGARNLLSSSLHASSSLGMGTTSNGYSSSPPRRYSSFGDENRWREGVF